MISGADYDHVVELLVGLADHAVASPPRSKYDELLSSSADGTVYAFSTERSRRGETICTSGWTCIQRYRSQGTATDSCTCRSGGSEISQVEDMKGHWYSSQLHLYIVQFPL